MNVIDTITADQIEVGDLVAVEGDNLTVTHVSDEGTVIVVSGESLVEGDKVTHVLCDIDSVDLLGA